MSDRSDLDRKVSALYEALRQLARRALGGSSGPRLIDPTELVSESYVRLAGREGSAPERRTEFLALATSVIRSVLVDRAREQLTLRRGGHAQRVTLSSHSLLDNNPSGVDVLGLDEALTKLAALDARQARVVELKFFGGLEIDEIAHVLNVSPRTVDGDWALARAWLHRELSRSTS